MAALEGGADAVAFSSGSAATLAVFQALAPGDHVVAPVDAYHGTGKQLARGVPRWGVEASVRVHGRIPANVEQALGPSTTLVWVETPSNPLLRVSDIAAIAAIARAAGALLGLRQHLGDARCCSGRSRSASTLSCTPRRSTSAGTADVLGGVVVAREDDALLRDGSRHPAAAGGGVPSPFDCWLVLRGVPTLPLRVRAQSEYALAVARVPREPTRASSAVHYPGLDGHPGHALARAADAGGYGAVVSFQVPGGADRAIAVAARTKLFTRATSLGGVESLIEHRASMEAAGAHAARRTCCGSRRARAPRRPDRGPGPGPRRLTSAQLPAQAGGALVPALSAATQAAGSRGASTGRSFAVQPGMSPCRSCSRV